MNAPSQKPRWPLFILGTTLLTLLVLSMLYLSQPAVLSPVFGSVV